MECCICYESGDLIEYNHCGNYYVHETCLNEWKKNVNECLICRKSYNTDIDSSTTIEIEREFGPRNNVVCTEYNGLICLRLLFIAGTGISVGCITYSIIVFILF